MNAGLITALAISLSIQVRAGFLNRKNVLDGGDVVLGLIVASADFLYSSLSIHKQIMILQFSPSQLINSTDEGVLPNQTTDQAFEQEPIMTAATYSSLSVFFLKCLILSTRSYHELKLKNKVLESSEKTKLGLQFNVFQNSVATLGDLLLFVILFTHNRTAPHIANSLFLMMSALSFAVSLASYKNKN